MPDLDPIRAQAGLALTAYLGNHSVAPDQIQSVFDNIYRALSGHGLAPATAAPDTEEKVLHPAVPIKKSVFPDYIICLEDGKKLKTLKRHLRHFGMSPEQYKQKWGLPDDYPMVAPNYAAHRSSLAKSIGLGRKAAPVEALPAPAEASAPATPAKQPQRLRGGKASTAKRKTAAK